MSIVFGMWRSLVILLSNFNKGLKELKKKQQEKIYRQDFWGVLLWKGAENWCGGFRGKYKEFWLRMGEGRLCLCMNGNNPAERKMSIMWERKGLCLQKHHPSGSERGWDQLAARQFVHCNRRIWCRTWEWRAKIQQSAGNMRAAEPLGFNNNLHMKAEGEKGVQADLRSNHQPKYW